MSELTTAIKAYLFQAGTQGRLQSEIFRRFQYITREEVINELNALWSEEKVQRFTLKPNVFTWRATENFNM